LRITCGLLICTLISENQGLLQTLEKFQVLQTWIFFLGSNLDKKLDLYHKPEKKSRWQTEKKSRCAGPEIFLRFETDIDFQKSRWRLKGRWYVHTTKEIEIIPRTTDTQWRHKWKKSEIFGRCGRQNMLWPYLNIWDWDLIFGCAVKTISSPGVRSPWTMLLKLLYIQQGTMAFLQTPLERNPLMEHSYLLANAFS
jgi:hypothetical protein